MKQNRNDENWVRPESQRPQGQRPQNRRPQGQRPQGQYPARDTGRYPNDAIALKRKKRKGSVFGARIALFLSVLLVLAVIGAAVFAIYFFSTSDKPDSTVRITYGKETQKVDGDVAYQNSQLYLSFDRIGSYLKLSRTGNTDSVRFVFASDDASSEGNGEEYVEFYRDQIMAFVSGTEIRLSAPARFSGGEVLVPAEFVRTYMVGLKVDENKDDGKVTVEREKLEETDDKGEKLEARVTLSLKAAVGPKPLDTSTPSPNPVIPQIPDVSFVNDLSAYEKYMNPTDDSEYLILVNKTNKVGAELVPSDLVDVKNTRTDRSARQMRECAEKALEALYIEMNAAGYTDVSVTSAYRSYEEQDYLYNSYVTQEMASGITKEQAMTIVDTYSARPGTSEHQTGLCCDMHNLPAADQAFANKEAYSWLKENAWKFGFIERFPKDKEDVTGYSFEPWHYRFVGRRVAYQIHSAGITLEEYLNKG